MRLVPGGVRLLAAQEIDAIQDAAFRILARVGMCIENERMLQHLEAHGALVDYQVQRARFTQRLVETFLAESTHIDWEAQTPQVTASAGIYNGPYHDPETRALVPWTEERLATYIALARALPHVGRAGMLGCRLDKPAKLEPLYERFYCWKYGASDHGTIHLDELCPAVYDLCQLRAEQLGQPLREVFRGTAYLIPALKLGRHEAHQFLYFWERGLPVHLGDMYAMGATSPVTLAGSLALSLAEQLGIGILQRAFHGGDSFGLGCSLSVLDMRTMIYPYGRPEMALTNMAMAQVAQRLGLPFGGHAGLTDAKQPSAEAGAQKALTAIPTLLAAGHVHVDAGLLSIDEVFSPLQLILDNELCGALKHLCQEFHVTGEELALELIEELGPGGHYMATEHTVKHFRHEHWQPTVWSRQMLTGWQDEGCLLDVDRAAEVYRAMLPELDTRSRLSEAHEAELLRFIVALPA
ncbi:MAG: trimethylamine methyltransferase family protein [Anaerolineae bacterium]